MTDAPRISDPGPEMAEQLVQLYEICNEAHGSISPEEIREHFGAKLIRDWADRECLPASEAAKARLIGLEQWEAWKREQAARV